MFKRIDHAILLHGYAETPDRVWFPWMHRELEDRGIRVTVPQLPDPLRPNYKRWMNKVLPLAKEITASTVVIGHSLGGVLALRMLEKRLSKKAAAAVLVSSPFAATIRVDAMMRFFHQPVDWMTVRGAAREFVNIHAKDDPLVPFDHAIRYQEALGSELILTAKGGHFTAKKAPLVLHVVNRLLQ